MQFSTGSSDDIYAGVTTGADAASHAAKEVSVDVLPKPGGEPPQEQAPADLTPRHVRPSFWQRWYPAFRNILPIYIALHLALFIMSCYAFLYTNKDFSSKVMPVSLLWSEWYHWDASYYLHIAMSGYIDLRHMAFFPLYPLLERVAWPITQNLVTAGLLVSNVAELIMFVVLYRLIEEDFNGERAYHTVLYLAIFPSAFFFSAGYTESVFLCLSILSFYQIRQGHWWLAGLFGFLASLTRPDGLFLLLPFCYESLRRIWRGGPLRSLLSREQITGLWRSLRLPLLCGLCLPAGIALFMAYGYYQFHDPLAFVHAHAYWGRSLHFPGYGMLKAAWAILRRLSLNFLTLRTLIDLGADALILLLIVLSFIGPWKLPRSLWSYGLYAAALYVYLQLFPKDGTYPLESMSRFVLELFPAFLMLSRISRFRTLHLSYCMVSGALFFFLLTQFLTGHWVL